MVPTYKRQKSVPGSTGMQNIPLSLATSPLSGVGAGITQIAGQLDVVADRMQRRQDVVSRGRDENAFSTSVSTEWQRVQDEDDMTSPETIQNFNRFVLNKKQELLSNHVGGKDSSAMLETSISNLEGRYERAAISGGRTAVIANLQGQFSDKLTPLTTAVSNGTMTYAAAMTQLNSFASGEGSIGEAMPTSISMDSFDAAASMLAIGSINNDLTKGTLAGNNAALEQFNANPSFGKVLSPSQLQAIHRKISEQRTSLNMANNEYANKRNQFAIDRGYRNYSEVPDPMKMAFASGFKILPKAPREMASPEGKQMADRAALLAAAGGDENDASVKGFDTLIKAASSSKASSATGKLFEDLKRMEDSGVPQNDPAHVAIKRQIDKSNPEWVAAEDRKVKWPNASIAFKTFNRQALSLEKDAKQALMYLTGTKTIMEAKKAALNKSFSGWTTGFIGTASSLRGGSDRSELDAILTRIGGKAMLDALAAMKASSPNGASGMGALNETEGNALRFQEGALSSSAPSATASTLVSLIDGTQSVIKNQQIAIIAAFPTLGKDIKAMYGEAKTDSDGLGGGDEVKEIVLDLNGNPVGNEQTPASLKTESFDEIDANGDGVASPEELAASRARR